MGLKVFISQKMRGKTPQQIVGERLDIQYACVQQLPEGRTLDFIDSYKPELAFKDPITSLGQSLALLADADLVVVPLLAIQNVRWFIRANMELDQIMDYEPSIQTIADLGEFAELRGCEYEFLIAQSYGKLVCYYDEHFQLTPLV